MPESPRILIVDDNEHLAQNLHEILADDGLDVTVCADGVQALDRLGAAAYDLVITDYRMPRMDGLELADWIRRHRPEVPVVMFSGYAGELDPEVAGRLGLTELLHKPQDLPRLVVRAGHVARTGSRGEE